MNWLQLGGSLVAIVALAGIAWALRLGGAALAGPDAARQIAEDLLPGFDAHAAWVAPDGETALVLGTGDAALVRRHGARFVARPGTITGYAADTRTATLDIGEAKPAIVTLDAGADAALLSRLGEAADTGVS